MKKGLKVSLGIAAIAMGVGILVMSIGYAMGGFKRVAALADTIIFKEDTVVDVTSLDFNIPYGKIRIVEGSEYKLEVNEEYEEYFTSEVSGGVWKIEGDEDITGFNLFGISLPFVSWGKQGFHDELEIIITIPTRASFSRADISMGAGVLDADKIHAEHVQLTVGTGEMRIGSLIAEGKMDIEAGAGNVSIKEARVNEANIDCGVGKVYFAGEILSKCMADCGVGVIEMKLKNKEEECYYSIDCGIGNVIINNKSYHGHKDGVKGVSSAPVHFDLSCAVGEIKVYNQ